MPFEIYKFDLKLRRLKVIAYAETLESAHRHIYKEWHKNEPNFYFFAYPKGFQGEYINL